MVSLPRKARQLAIAAVLAGRQSLRVAALLPGLLARIDLQYGQTEQQSPECAADTDQG